MSDWSYADRIRADELVPQRRPPPGGGWRRLVYRATLGLINAGPSPDERRQADLEAKIRGALRGHFKVGVMGRGGSARPRWRRASARCSPNCHRTTAWWRSTPTPASASSAPASTRRRWARIQAGRRPAPRFVRQYLRSRVGNNAAGLFVLTGESTPARRRVLHPAIYREATSRLDRHFTIAIVDCSSTMDAPVTQEVLRDLDALIVVSSPSFHGAAAAGQTLDWLANRGLTAAHRHRVQPLRRAHTNGPARSSAAVRRPRPGGHRGALRRASATRRCHRVHQPDVGDDATALHRDRCRAGRAVPAIICTRQSISPIAASTRAHRCGRSLGHRDRFDRGNGMGDLPARRARRERIRARGWRCVPHLLGVRARVDGLGACTSGSTARHWVVTRPASGTAATTSTTASDASGLRHRSTPRLRPHRHPNPPDRRVARTANPPNRQNPSSAGNPHNPHIATSDQPRRHAASAARVRRASSTHRRSVRVDTTARTLMGFRPQAEAVCGPGRSARTAEALRRPSR